MVINDIAAAAARDMFDTVIGYDGHYSEYVGAFSEGAMWYAGHMAVCEFLSDLAVRIELNNLNPYMNVHPDDGGWFPGQHPNRSRR